MTKKLHGFTLIEMMIVLSIIGILAAVAIPQFNTLMAKSKEATVKGQLGSIRSALSIYFADTEGTFPTGNAPGVLANGLTSNNRYMRSLPVIAIPTISTLNNPGHPPNDQEATVPVNDTCPPTITDNPGTIYYYVYWNTNLCWGNLYINCTHNTYAGNPWSSY